MKAITPAIFFIFFFFPAYSQSWRMYADSAKTYNDQKNPDKAIELYNEAKQELQKDSAITNSYAEICDSLGVSFYRKKQYKETEKYYLEVRQIREKVLGKENPDYANSCNDLAVLYFDMGQLRCISFAGQSTCIVKK